MTSFWVDYAAFVAGRNEKKEQKAGDAALHFDLSGGVCGVIWCGAAFLIAIRIASDR